MHHLPSLAALLCTAWISGIYQSHAPLPVSSQPLAHLAGTTPSNTSEPLQQRSALVNDTAIRLQWNTYANDTNLFAYYGAQGTALNTFQRSAAAVSTTYNTSLTWVHTVLITGLQPYTVYEWYVTNTNCTACQQIPLSTCKTSLTKGSKTPYTIGVFGDLGLMGVGRFISTPLGVYEAAGLENVGPGKVVAFPSGGAQTDPAYDQTHNTMLSLNTSVTKGEVDFLLHVGDICYADYVYNILPKQYFTTATAPNFTDTEAASMLYEAVTEAYYDQIQPFTSQRAYMVAPGNHEATCSNGKNIDMCFPGQLNFTGYNTHWAMPSQESGGVLNMFYSIDYGMTHFVVLNGETDFYNSPGGIGSGFTGKIEDQYGQGPFVEPAVPNKYLTWLEADLARVNRSVTPWIVAIHHRPWYCSQVGRQQSAQVVFEPLFLKYGVDLVASGHVHNYERMTPIQYGGIPDPAGYYNPSSPVYVVEGSGGHFGGLDYADAPIGYGGSGDPRFPQLIADGTFEPYTRYADSDNYGWAKITFLNATHLRYDHITSVNSQVVDSFTLIKDHGTGLITSSPAPASATATGMQLAKPANATTAFAIAV